MTTTAISAQGATLKINTGTGSAINISGATKGAPAILTLASVAALALGNVGTIASVGGMVELNGQKVVVQYIDSVGVKIALANVNSAAYTTYTTGGTFTPQTYTAIANLKTFGGMDGEASDLDVSNCDSTAMEYIPGLREEGTFAVEVDYDVQDAGQLAMDAARAASAVKTFVLTLPNGRTATFSGYVKKFGKQGGVNQVMKGSITIRITGAVVWA